MRTSLAVTLILLLVFAHASPRAAGLPFEELVTVRVQTRDRAVIADLAQRHTHLLVEKEKGFVMFEADAVELAQMRAQGLDVSIDEAATAAQRGAKSGAPGPLAGIVNFPCYRTVAESRARFDALLAQYPQFVRVVDIGDSWERTSGAAGGGEDLRVIQLTNANIAGPKPKFFMMTGIHAREYTPVEVGLRLVEWLLENYGKNADATWLLDHQELHMLVQSNPDGRRQAELGSLWRKNTNVTYCPAGRRGSDLNRNYPFEWGMHSGSSGSACDETYRGPFPASEPETQAVINYVRAQFPDSRGPLATDAAPANTSGLFFDMHSYSKLVLWPWGYTSQVPPNGPALETLGRRFAWFNGYAPQQAVDLYVTDGTTDDFAYGELGLAAYTFELGNQFFETCAAFESTVFPDNFAALLYAMRVTRAPYLLPSGPEARAVGVEPDIAFPGEALTVRGTLDDTRFNQSLNGTEPSHALLRANMYVQIAPWQGGANVIAANAADGAFDEANENVVASIAGGFPAVGKHLVYLQGTDASGATGPVAAAFADVRAPAVVGTVTGRVRDSRTLMPLVAEIRASEFVSRSGADGNYSRRLPAGTHTISINATDYEGARVDAFVVQGGTNLVLDADLLPLCTVLGEDAMGAAPGWTLQSPWAIVEGNAGHASRFFADSPLGNYANGANTSLTSPALNMSLRTNPVLSFESRCDTEAGYDFGLVEMRNSQGGTWSEIYRCDGNPQWQDVRIALPQFADSSFAQFRFRLTSNGNVVRDGWSIDNITLKAGGSPCRAAIPGEVIFANGME